MPRRENHPDYCAELFNRCWGEFSVEVSDDFNNHLRRLDECYNQKIRSFEPLWYPHVNQEILRSDYSVFRHIVKDGKIGTE